MIIPVATLSIYLLVGLVQTDNLIHPITHIDVSADQKTYLTCSLNSNIYLLDVQSGKILNAYTDPIHYQHVTYKSEAVFHSNSKHVVGGSENGSILLWNLLTAKVDHIIPPNSPLSSSSSSSTLLGGTQSKAMFISSSYDGTAKIWEDDGDNITVTS